MATDVRELRLVASYWHGGQFTPLYAFVSTGTIVEGIGEEIESCLEHASPEDRAELKALLEFVEPACAGSPDWRAEHPNIRVEVGDGCGTD